MCVCVRARERVCVCVCACVRVSLTCGGVDRHDELPRRRLRVRRHLSALGGDAASEAASRRAVEPLAVQERPLNEVLRGAATRSADSTETRGRGGEAEATRGRGKAHHWKWQHNAFPSSSVLRCEDLYPETLKGCSVRSHGEGVATRAKLTHVNSEFKCVVLTPCCSRLPLTLPRKNISLDIYSRTKTTRFTLK